MDQKPVKKSTNKRILFPEDDWCDITQVFEIDLKDKEITLDTFTTWKQQHRILKENYMICNYVISRNKN